MKKPFLFWLRLIKKQGSSAFFSAEKSVEVIYLSQGNTEQKFQKIFASKL